MKFINLSKDTKLKWDTVVENSDDAWMYHQSDWVDFTAEVWGCEPLNFMTELDGNIVAVFPLHRARGDNQLLSTVMGTGGPAIRHGVSPAMRQKILDANFEQVESIAKSVGAPSISIALPVLSKSALNSRWGVNPLVNYHYEDASTHSWVIDLHLPLEEIYDRLSRNAKREINQAKKAGYTIRLLKSAAEMDRYYQIHCETYARTGIKPHPKAYFDGIYANMVVPGHARVWVAEKDGEIVGATNIGTFKKTANYWTTCCLNDHYQNGVYYQLLWHAIESAKNEGYQWFDCAEAFPNARGGKIKGLSDYKSKFGGELHRYFKGKLTLDEGMFSAQIPLRSRIANFLRPLLGETALNKIAHMISVAKGTIMIVKRPWAWWHEIPYMKPYWNKQELRVLVSARGSKHAQTLNEECRQAIKTVLGAEGTVITTSSGRTALRLALSVLKKQFPNKKGVVIPTYGCRGTFDPIVENNLVPYFADIDQNLNIAQESVRGILLKKDDVLAVLVPHLGGAKADIEAIASLAKHHGVIVIEDVCQAFGGQDRRGYWGKHSDMAIFSFGMGKNVMATSGGALLTNIFKDEVVQKARVLRPEADSAVRRRAWGMAARNIFRLTSQRLIQSGDPYGNHSMHPLDASLVMLQLQKLDTIVQARQQNAGRIIEAIQRSGLPIRIQSVDSNIYTKLALIIDDLGVRQSLKRNFLRAGIEIEPMYVPLHLRDFGQAYGTDDLSESEQVYPKVFNIPVRPNLSEKDILRICRVIQKMTKNVKR